MTREKALLKTKDYLTDLLPSEDYDEVEEIIKALSQEPCEDAISRKDLLSKAWFVTGDYFPIEGLEYITKGMVEHMPPVIPQPKTGHWIYRGQNTYECFECNKNHYGNYGPPYCENCGTRMIKSEEY